MNINAMIAFYFLVILAISSYASVISTRNDVKSRVERELHLTEDLKDTPCAPNDFFYVDCNLCACKPDHSGYICSDHDCIQFRLTNVFEKSRGGPSALFNHGEELDVPKNGEEVDRDNNLKNNADEFSCIPGQKFAKACNSCICTPDGKNAICTLRSCGTTEAGVPQ